MGGQPCWNNWAWMRCCQLRRSSINRQYNRPRMGVSTTAGRNQDSGNRPSNTACAATAHRRDRSWRASSAPATPEARPDPPHARRCPPRPNSSQTYRHPASPPTRTRHHHPGSARPASAATHYAWPDEPTRPHHTVVIHVIERDLLPITSKPPTIVIGPPRAPETFMDAISVRPSRGGPQHMSSQSGGVRSEVDARVGSHGHRQTPRTHRPPPRHPLLAGYLVVDHHTQPQE